MTDKQIEEIQFQLYRTELKYEQELSDAELEAEQILWQVVAIVCLSFTLFLISFI